ncbi:MAG: carbohydrate kinase family protein [Chloroflexales bacterium]|nr:carbohydrate kinase family protein [Chloroflexales bacterium]
MEYDNHAHILVLGDINVDQTIVVPAYPPEGHDVTAQFLDWGSGGAGLNAATMFARLGGRVRLLGRIGSDLAAQVALAVACEAGVDISTVQRDEQTATGLCSAVVSSGGQRTFFSFRGANVLFDPEIIDVAIFAGVDLLYLSAYALLAGPQRIAALRAIELAARCSVPVMLDLGIAPAQQCQETLLNALPNIWLLTLNEDELHLLIPEHSDVAALDMLLSGGVKQVALKRGARGCLVANRDCRLEVLPPAVTVVDTNGCGDAFSTGLAWAFLHHAPVAVCATFGNVLGALTATRLGSAVALPARSAILSQLDPALHYLVLPPRKEV